MRRKLLFFVLLASIGLTFFSANMLFSKDVAIKLSQVADPGEKMTFENDLILQIGETTPSLVVKFSQEFSAAEIETRETALTHDAYIRILDTEGNLVAGEYTEVRDNTPIAPIYGKVQGELKDDLVGVSYFWIDAPKTYEVRLKPGYMVELHAETAEFISTLDGKAAPAFKPIETVERYVVTVGGLRKANWTEAEGEDQMYELLRRRIAAMIEDYQAKVSDEVLNNRYLDAATKAQLILAHRSLRAKDQELYREFIEHLRVGGVPVITYHGEREYFVGDTVDFSTLVSATDGEDGEIAPEEISVDSQANFELAGEYILIYGAKDSDGNTTKLTISITINAPNVPVEVLEPEPEEPSTEAPSFTPPSHQEPVTVIPDTDLALDESEDFSSTGSPNIPSATNTTVTVGSGANSVGKVDDEQANVILREDEGTHTPSTEELDAIAETIRPTNNTVVTTSDEDTAKSKNVNLTQILLIAGGILLLAGLIRFIFDHYVR